MLEKARKLLAKGRWVAAEVRARVGEQRVAQAGRFVRVAAFAGLAIWLEGGHQLTWSAAWVAVAGAGEVLYRQVRQTVSAGSQADPAEPSGDVMAPEDMPAV